MWVVIAIIMIALLVYLRIKSKYNVPNNEASINAVPADVPGIMNFLHSFNALCSTHEIDSTDVLISCKQVDDGYEIIAYTKIFKIDSQNASDSVDVLRMTVSAAKNRVESSHKKTDALELYQLKRKAADKVILDFFGTDHLAGCFWDIDDCDYIDGKYLEFEEKGMIFNSLNQSRNKTLDLICSRTIEKYSNARISRQGGDRITISFS